MSKGVPTIWVLKSFRAGDNAQALALAGKITGTIVEKQMGFNRLAFLPNLLAGLSIRMLTNASKSLLVGPWPDLVIAAGRRNAILSLWIKNQSAGKTKVVQLGRPRLPLQLFDLVITTPQYGLPPGPNIVQLPMPFITGRKTSPESFSAIIDQWQELAKPWVVAVVGGQKLPLQLGKTELEAFGSSVNKLAKKKNAGVILLNSPRSPKDALSIIARQITRPKWLPSPESASAYQAALATGDFFCVTSDSISMISEMLSTNKPVFVHELPELPLAIHWNAQHGIAARLARNGLLCPPRSVASMVRGLLAQKIVGDLEKATEPTNGTAIAPQHEAAIQRVRLLI